jgi:hypothetical protein
VRALRDAGAMRTRSSDTARRFAFRHFEPLITPVDVRVPPGRERCCDASNLPLVFDDGHQSEDAGHMMTSRTLRVLFLRSPQIESRSRA